MNRSKEVAAENILSEVMKSIRTAQLNVCATMDISEELQQPLPAIYFSLLQEKAMEGISITRLGFGRKEDFNKLISEVTNETKNYIFFHTESDNYKRMILVDDDILFFAKKVDGVNQYFKTTDEIVINEYKKYFGNHTKQLE